MKKYTFIKIAFVFATAFVAAPAFASTTASFSPTTITAAPGGDFSVTVAIDPHSTSNFAEKLELKYPADLIEVKSFSFAPTWMALSQPGYDTTDNANGVLVKTAGYPTGFSSSTTFATVTFHAKAAGSGTIALGSNATAFEENMQSPITGSGVAFTIKALDVVASVGTTASSMTGTYSSMLEKTASDAPSDITPETAPDIQSASVIGSGFRSSWILWFLVLLALVSIGYREYKGWKKKQGEANK